MMTEFKVRYFHISDMNLTNVKQVLFGKGKYENLFGCIFDDPLKFIFGQVNKNGYMEYFAYYDLKYRTCREFNFTATKEIYNDSLKVLNDADFASLEGEEIIYETMYDDHNKNLEEYRRELLHRHMPFKYSTDVQTRSFIKKMVDIDHKFSNLNI